MKYISTFILLIILFSASNANSQNLRKDSVSFNVTERILIRETSRISRFDTVKNSTKLTIVMGYDLDNRIVRKESYFYSDVIDFKWKQVELFNIAGNLVLDIIYDEIPNGISSRHSFEYDNQNRLIIERFIFVEFEERRIEYKYNKKGKLIKKMEYHNGVLFKEK